MTKFKVFTMLTVIIFLLHIQIRKLLCKGIHYHLESLSLNLYKRLLHLMPQRKAKLNAYLFIVLGITIIFFIM